MVSHSCQTNKIMCCFDISCIDCALLSIFPLATGSIYAYIFAPSLRVLTGLECVH